MYHLTPPTETYTAGSDSLWGRIPHTRGLALVVYADGSITTERTAPAANEDGVLYSWPGGRTYTITDEQAELLTEAGYASLLEVVA